MGKMNIGNSWISKYNYGCCDTSIPLFAEHRYGMGNLVVQKYNYWRIYRYKCTNSDAFGGA
jgi:hypothetical protein